MRHFLIEQSQIQLSSSTLFPDGRSFVFEDLSKAFDVSFIELSEHIECPELISAPPTSACERSLF